PLKNEYELKELYSLESPKRELIMQAKLNKKLKKNISNTNEKLKR
ncbi:3594_t:CDS:1, partial [Gigaspora margarita]